MEVVNMAPSDELVFSAIGAATVHYELLGRENVAVKVRDAIQHREEQIQMLRRQLAEAEAANAAETTKLAEAVVDELVRRLA